MTVETLIKLLSVQPQDSEVRVSSGGCWEPAQGVEASPTVREDCTAEWVTIYGYAGGFE